MQGQAKELTVVLEFCQPGRTKCACLKKLEEIGANRKAKMPRQRSRRITGGLKYHIIRMPQNLILKCAKKLHQKLEPIKFGDSMSDLNFKSIHFNVSKKKRRKGLEEEKGC